MTLSQYLKAHCPEVTLNDLEAVTGKSRNTLHQWWRTRRDMMKCLILGMAMRQLARRTERSDDE